MNFIKTVILALLLSVPVIHCMEEQNREESQPQLLEDLGLPNELWAQILAHAAIHCNHSILDQSTDIYEAINIIEKDIEYRHITISLVCKTFKNLNISQEQLTQLKKQIRELYIPFLNEKFLEKHEGNEGLYPKNGSWHNDSAINDEIALFILTGTDSLQQVELLDKIINREDDSSALPFIKLLLFYGANTEAEKLGKMTSALPRAIAPNKEQTLKLLLESGANPNITEEKFGGYCPLQLVSFINELNLITEEEIAHNPEKIGILGRLTRLLLSHGANPNSLNNYDTPLCFAIATQDGTNNHKDCISILLEYGANPHIVSNAQGTEGYTALHHAIRAHDDNYTDNRDIIRLLLENGANPYLKNSNNKTAFACAAEQGLDDFEQLVNKYTKNLSTRHFYKIS